MVAEWAAGIAAKAAGPLAGRLVLTVWQRSALSWTVAWRIRGRTKELNLPVPPYWAFRRYLGAGEPLLALRRADPEGIEALAQDLRRLRLGPNWRLSDAGARQLVDLLLSAYTQGVSTKDAIEIQSAATRAEIKVASRSSASTFEVDLQSFSTVRAQQAKSLYETWPQVHRFVHEFASASDPRTALLDWTQNRPAWLVHMSVEALMWLADLASDYGLKAEAIGYIDEGLKQGATPAKYWKVRRDLLENAPSPDVQREWMQRHEGHPLADAIVEATTGSPQRALEILDTWDVVDVSGRALKTSIRCQLLAASGDVEEAVRIAREVLENDRITGPAHLAAGYLLKRGAIRDSVLRFRDLEDSLEMALVVRDIIRMWRGPSHHAVVTAMKAAQALGNNRLAWRLSQLPPSGEATQQEAKDLAVRNFAAVIAAEIRPEKEALDLLSTIEDVLTRLEARALMLEHSQDRKTAENLWMEAAQMATSANDQIRFGFQLAMHGVTPPHLEKLAVEVPEVADDLRLVAAAFRGVAGQFEALRARARTRRTLAFSLYRYFELREEFDEAAKAAAAAAKQWSDAELWYVASQAYLLAGDRQSAVASARSALRVAGTHWGKFENVYATLVEVLSSERRWQEAADAAAALMARNPRQPDAVWALVECQVQLGELDEAWKTYGEFGGMPSPRSEREAVLRIELRKRYQNAEEWLEDLFDVLDSFEHSKQVRAFATNAMLMLDADLSEDMSEQIRLRLKSLLPSLEDVFIPQKVDLENPLATLDSLVANIPDTSDLDRQVEEGKVPFGLAASIHHRSYGELLASRTGPVFAGRASTFENEVIAARAARNSDVVVDLSALLSVGFFGAELAEQLLGYLGDMAAPLQQFRDTVDAVEALSRRSTMSVGRSSEGTAQVYTISEQEAEQRFQRAQQMHTRFQNVRTQERTEVTNIAELQAHGEVFVWLTALDLALDQTPRPLWCDDSMVRQLASGMGIPTFGTSALIEAMRLDKILSYDLATMLQATLIRHHHVGSEFRRDWLESAATFDGWRARGCASFILWAPESTDPESMVNFVVEAVRHSAEEPDSVHRWVDVMSRWLIRVGGRDSYSNLVLFLRRLLAQPWLTSAQLPFVLAGIRAATTSAKVADPFEAAMTGHYHELVEKAGPAVASQYVRGFVRLANEEDRTATNRVILTS